jgi:hypothetical protein
MVISHVALILTPKSLTYVLAFWIGGSWFYMQVRISPLIKISESYFVI